MLIFTLKARRLINQAVNAFGNDHQRLVWRTWASAHPDIRRGPADPYDDGAGALSPEVATVARTVLNQLFDATQRRLGSSSLSEDDIADISNDLAFIRSVVKTLNRHAPLEASIGQGVSV
jgi:hypothetical protein